MEVKMDFLNELFDVYKKTNKIKFKEIKETSNQQMDFGDIIEIYAGNQMLIAVVISDSNEALLMSEFIEFATNTDFIVSINHAIAEKWIIETDKKLYLNSGVKYRIVTKLGHKDSEILRKILKGNPVPAEKSGPKIPPNPKDPRYKFKLEELKKTMLVNKHLFFED
jgi:hypothetical protein